MVVLATSMLVILGVIGLIVVGVALGGLGVFGTGGIGTLSDLVVLFMRNYASEDKYLKEIVYIWIGSINVRQDCMSQLTSELKKIAQRSLRLSLKENKNTSNCCEVHFDRLVSYIMSERNQCTNRIPPNLRNFSTKFAADKKTLRNMIANKKLCPVDPRKLKCNEKNVYLKLKHDAESRKIPCDRQHSKLISSLAKKKLMKCYKNIGSKVFGTDCTKTLSYLECEEAI